MALQYAARLPAAGAHRPKTSEQRGLEILEQCDRREHRQSRKLQRASRIHDELLAWLRRRHPGVDWDRAGVTPATVRRWLQSASVRGAAARLRTKAPGTAAPVR